MTLVVGTDQHTGRSVGLARKLSTYCDLLLINYSCTIIEIEYEKELKVKIFFFTSISWYYGASHQHRRRFDLKTKFEELNWSF